MNKQRHQLVDGLKYFSVVPVLYLLSGAIVASESAYSNEFQGWSLATDQDLFYLIDNGKNEDRDYTIGVEYGLYGELAGQSLLHSGLNNLDALVGFDGWYNDEQQRSMHLGVKVYTPDDLANPDPIYDDRPYASLVYWSNQQRRIAQDRRSSLTTELSLGILGLEFAKEVQSFVHKISREISGKDTPIEPQGWQHQISDGGELTFRYHIEARHLLHQSNWYDLSYELAAGLGYQTGVSAGMLWRVGQRQSHFSQYESGPINQLGSLRIENIPQDNFVYLYYRLDGVLYNELLQGGFRDSAVTFDSDQIERAVHMLELGWSMTLKSGTRISFTQNIRSSEFKGANSRTHYWGGFYLSFPFHIAQ